jgi:hypothetical protein
MCSSALREGIVAELGHKADAGGERDSIRVLGPGPAVIRRLAGKYGVTVMVKRKGADRG